MPHLGECDAVPVDLSPVSVPPEFISIAASVLLGFRTEMVVRAVLCACGVGRLEAEAALARLQAARMIGMALEGHAERALAETIASAPLHQIGEYYYFDPAEFLGHLAKTEEAWRKASASDTPGGLWAGSSSAVRMAGE